MSFHDDVLNESVQPDRSKMAEVQEALGSEWDEFLEVMATPTLRSSAITRALHKRGVEISEATVRRYRRSKYGI